MADGFIPPHGGYRQLRSYQKAEIVYDVTVRFCERFVRRNDRTRDQMIQAARSGKQNIAEGSQVSGTSREMELKLVNVARASLQELLEDFRDFLRVRDLPLWDKNDSRSRAVRNLTYGEEESYKTYSTYIEDQDAETAANTAICLVHQANYLLDRQLRQLEQAFLSNGGLREAMTRARLEARTDHHRGGRL